jgi:MFS family permease
MTESKPGLFYGWVIVFLTFLSLSTYGLFYSYSGFIQSLEAEFHGTRAALSGVYTLYMAVYCLCAMPMGALCDRVGPRKTLLLSAVCIGAGTALCSQAQTVWHLYLFFGLVAGIGHGAIWVVATSTISRWFIAKRGLAMGIAACGIGAGLLLAPPLSVQVILHAGWRSAFLVLGAVFFAINLAVALLIKGSPKEMGLTPHRETGEKATATVVTLPESGYFSLKESFQARAFWFVYLIGLACFSAYSMAMVHIVPYSGVLGVPALQAALGLSCLGVGTIAGRISAGTLSDRFGRVFTLMACLGFEALGIFGLLAVSGMWTIYAAMFLIGVGYGGSVVLSSVLLGDFFGLKHLGAITGVWLTHGALAGPLGPLAGGVVYDATSSYFLAILLAGLLCTLAMGVAALLRPPQRTGL